MLEGGPVTSTGLHEVVERRDVLIDSERHPVRGRYGARYLEGSRAPEGPGRPRAHYRRSAQDHDDPPEAVSRNLGRSVHIPIARCRVGAASPGDLGRGTLQLVCPRNTGVDNVRREEVVRALLHRHTEMIEEVVVRSRPVYFDGRLHRGPAGSCKTTPAARSSGQSTEGFISAMPQYSDGSP